MILLDGGNLFGSSHGRVVLLKTVVVAFMVFIAMSARQYVNSKLPRSDELTIPTADRLRRAFGAEAAAGLRLLRGDLDRLSGGAVHQGIVLQVPAYKYAEPDSLMAAVPLLAWGPGKQG